ncbi:MAG: TolC family protein [Candidatus Omnitrophica bacterium]|nr:TolC family protein [Candidatus Omnitrophota bacterium]
MRDNNKFRCTLLFYLMAAGFLFSDFSFSFARSQDQDTANPQQEILLSLEEVTRLALENNLDIQIAKFDAYLSRTSLRKVRSMFDTFLTAAASFSRDRSEQASVFAGTDSRNTRYSLGLEKKLPSGTTLSMDASTSKMRTNSTFSSLNPYNDARLGFSVKQALGKNFFGLSDRSDLKLTTIDIENSEFTSLDDIEEAIFSVQKAFWLLALREQEVRVSKDMLEEASKLYEVYKEKKPLGLVEAGEFLAVEALVVTREISLKLAELALETANNDLLFLLNVPEADTKLILKDNLKTEPKKADFYEELNQALGNRRDYKIIKNELTKNDIELVVKKNALFPEIDLEATFSRNNLDDNPETAWGHLAGENTDQLYVGLNLKFPLEQNAERADLEFTNLKKQQLAAKFQQIERKIIKELNNDVNKVNTYAKQIRLYEKTASLQRSKLEEEKKRLAYGRSNADTLVRYEEDLFQAELALATSLYNYRLSLLELDLGKNILLEKYWQDPL